MSTNKLLEIIVVLYFYLVGCDCKAINQFFLILENIASTCSQKARVEKHLLSKNFSGYHNIIHSSSGVFVTG